MNEHLITGVGESAHVTSENQGAINIGLLGSGNKVFDYLNCFEASVIDKNTIRIKDGLGIIEGRYFEIKRGSYVDAKLANNSDGTKRIDLIVATYNKSDDKIETIAIDVIKGEASASNPTVPMWGTGSIVEGATSKDFPLYEVHIDGISNIELVPAFEKVEPLTGTIADVVSELDGKMNAENPSGFGSINVGSGNSANDVFSQAFGYGTTASGQYAHSEGNGTQANGDASHAEGEETHANGPDSHAEGLHTTSSGDYSHAEGEEAQAIAKGSHAEGFQARAEGNYSHAEGMQTLAKGKYSHASGQNTKANSTAQTAVGKFNDNKGTNIFEVGNGTADNARSNAFYVTNEGIAGAKEDFSVFNGTKTISLKNTESRVTALENAGGDDWEEIPSSDVTVTKSGSSSYFTITLRGIGRGIVWAVAARIPFDIVPEEILDQTRGIVLCGADYGGSMTIKSIYNTSGTNVNTQGPATIQFAISSTLSDRQRSEARFFKKKII